MKRNAYLISFASFFIAILVVFRKLFSSYFVADEWFHFTHYLPLTKKPDGLFTAIISPFTHGGALSGGEHVTPIASIIFFLNTKFFGMWYAPYAFMSLLLHSLNSFLVFCLILISLKNNPKRILFALSGGVFFAFAQTPLHTVTGAAPFYGENILSVTFVLLCILLVKLAYSYKNKRYLYFSFLSFFVALFSKETAGYLFVLLPLVIFFEERKIQKKIFPLKSLGIIFIFCSILYMIIRFVIPSVTLEDKVKTRVVDTGTIVSHDLSIHKNLPLEVAFRTITYPIRMTGTVFVPRATVMYAAEMLAPIVRPSISGGDRTGQVEFILGSGPYTIIYLLSIGIIWFVFFKIREFFKTKKHEEKNALIFGISTIFLASLPLVVIIFTFPRWGYDSYFDSRYYYHSTIGAAVIFPFLLFSLSGFFARLLRKPVNKVVVAVFLSWFVYNYYIFNASFNEIVNKYNEDRREVLVQLKGYLPRLPNKVVFYTETDGNSIYGPILPFQTSVPQAITVYYYDTSPLPDSFFEQPLFGGQGEGYEYSDGQGFGYYTSKKKLAEDLSKGKFELSDVYAYHYKASEVKLLDTSDKIRQEVRDIIEKNDQKK